MTSRVVPLKQYNTQSRISPEIFEQCSSTWHQKCASQKKHNDPCRAVSMTNVLPLVLFFFFSFSVKSYNTAVNIAYMANKNE